MPIIPCPALLPGTWEDEDSQDHQEGPLTTSCSRAVGRSDPVHFQVKAFNCPDSLMLFPAIAITGAHVVVGGRDPGVLSDLVSNPVPCTCSETCAWWCCGTALPIHGPQLMHGISSVQNLENENNNTFNIGWQQELSSIHQNPYRRAYHRGGHGVNVQ